MTTDLNTFNSTYTYFAKVVLTWKKDSLKHGNNRCCITGNKHDLEIHHLHKSFKEIVKESFKTADLPYSSSTKHLSLDDLTRLSNICIALHYKYGYGVIVSRRLHKKFHKEYKSEATPEAFREFKKNFKSKINKHISKGA